MTTFGARLSSAVEAKGPLCAGIDPHAALLGAWGLRDDVDGLERFTMTAVEALWLAKPPIGASRKMRRPIVLTIRQPPSNVPTVRVAPQASFTHSGTVNVSRCPEASRSAAITPIPFCASFAPWLRDSAALIAHSAPRIGPRNRRVAEIEALLPVNVRQIHVEQPPLLPHLAVQRRPGHGRVQHELVQVGVVRDRVLDLRRQVLGRVVLQPDDRRPQQHDPVLPQFARQSHRVRPGELRVLRLR